MPDAYMTEPLRCAYTGKRVFPDATEAKGVIGRTRAMNAYVCRFCGQWHVGHRRGQARDQTTDSWG